MGASEEEDTLGGSKKGMQKTLRQGVSRFWTDCRARLGSGRSAL